MRKLKDIGMKIQNAHKEYNDIARKSMVSMRESTANGGGSSMSKQDSLLVGLRYQPTDEDAKLKQETDFMQNIIDQRNNDINTIGDIMSNINEMAKDLAIETKVQGDKLLNLDKNMGDAEDNAKDALDQLKSADKNSKKATKCTKCLLIFIILLIIAVGLIVYFTWIKPSTK